MVAAREMSIGRFGAFARHAGQVGCIVKRFLLFGVLPLALTSAGCATVNQGTAVKTAMAAPASKTPAARTTQAAAAAAAVTPAAAATPAAPVLSPDADVSMYLSQAQQARKTGDMNQAIKILSQLVLVAPDNPQVVGEYGKTLASYGRSDDAVAFLDRAIQLQPGDWTLYSAQGVAYDQQGKYQSAQLSYARAMELKPGEVVVINNDALSHIQAGDYAGAEHLLNQVSRNSPDYSKISKSVALLAKLKPVTPAAAALPASDHQFALADPKPAAHEAAAASAPAMVPRQQAAIAQPPYPAAKEQVSVAQLPAIPNEEPVRAAAAPAIVPVDLPVAKAKQARPELAPAAPLRSTLDRLKADPSVVMAPLPGDHPEVVVVQGHLADGGARAAKAVHNASGAPSAHTVPGFYVQAGSFLSDARARQAATGLESLDVRIMQAVVNGREVFRLRIGPFADRADAQKSFEEAKALGRSDLIIVREQVAQD